MAAAAGGTAATGAAAAGEDATASTDATATATGASSSTSPYSSMGTMGSMGMGGMGGMYGSPYSSYGRSMYGDDGGYGGGMYGGMGGMYGGGMYGMGGGSSYADSMFRMTQMLEMNSIMLDQLQEHVSMTYNRFRDVASWIWALKDVFRPPQPDGQAPERQGFESEDAKKDALQRVRRRIRVLLVLLGLFLALVVRDSWRLSRDLAADGAWLKAAEGLQLEPPPVVAPPPPMGPGSPLGPGASSPFM
eukprot:CAMPEP_0175465132 /NCGR_PEP_ID=MMETSP0095-20121207/70128_1 /TAXON_ID=311494 /ORGANISM="Alexandrium monilatum, Strain CCMP3105" /LENGTH=246 /DNA_ID=CAMNT_0016766427 /DNA_START=53 /DNA_END=794 /DNA_ORIENTATION=+